MSTRAGHMAAQTSIVPVDPFAPGARVNVTRVHSSAECRRLCDSAGVSECAGFVFARRRSVSHMPLLLPVNLVGTSDDTAGNTASFVRDSLRHHLDGFYFEQLAKSL